MCHQLSILKRTAGWLDNSVFLGILWSLSRVSIVLLLAAAVIPWSQVRPADRLAYQALLFPCVTPAYVVTGQHHPSTRSKPGPFCTGSSIMPSVSLRHSLCTGMFCIYIAGVARRVHLTAVCTMSNSNAGTAKGLCPLPTCTETAATTGCPQLS